MNLAIIYWALHIACSVCCFSLSVGMGPHSKDTDHYLDIPIHNVSL